MIADCLKELRTLFMEVASHLPRVNIILQLSGITVIDEKSKVHIVHVAIGVLFRQRNDSLSLLLHPLQHLGVESCSPAYGQE